MLSLGQRMRAELVATFLHRPELVYLDEPTIGLDVITKRKILDFLLHINERYGTTIILTTHDLLDVEKICRRMILLDQGRIQYDGAVQAFVKGFGEKKRVILETAGGERPDLPKGFELVERHVDRWEYLIDTNQLDEKQVLKIISQIGNVRDVTFRDLDLSHVMQMWYAQKQGREPDEVSVALS
jgi:ABC-2 type transport system ATP-binding protein